MLKRAKIIPDGEMPSHLGFKAKTSARVGQTGAKVTSLKTLQDLCRDVYGISFETIKKAAYGDIGAIRQMSRMSDAAGKLKENLPFVRKAMEEVISSTTEYNVAMAAVLSQAANGANAIQAAVNNLEKTASAYGQKQTELQETHRFALEEQKLSQSFSAQLIGAKHLVASATREANDHHRLRQAASQPYLLDLRNEEQYVREVNGHNQEYGLRADDARFIEKKSVVGRMGLLKNWLMGR